MGSLYDIVEAFRAIGEQLRSTTEDAEVAREAVRGLNKERAAAAATDSAMGKAGGGGPSGMGASSGSSGSGGSGIKNASSPAGASISTGDLGDTRSAEDQMARLIASIKAAERR